MGTCTKTPPIIEYSDRISIIISIVKLSHEKSQLPIPRPQATPLRRIPRLSSQDRGDIDTPVIHLDRVVQRSPVSGTQTCNARRLREKASVSDTIRPRIIAPCHVPVSCTIFKTSSAFWEAVKTQANVYARSNCLTGSIAQRPNDTFAMLPCCRSLDRE